MRIYKKLYTNPSRVLLAGALSGLLVTCLQAQNGLPQSPGAASASAAGQAAGSPNQPSYASVVDELEAMKKRIEQLERQLNNQQAHEQTAPLLANPPAKPSQDPQAPPASAPAASSSGSNLDAACTRLRGEDRHVI